MRGITCQRWDILCWQVRRQNITLPYCDFELYDGKQTDCFCHATNWPRTQPFSLSNSSSVHLKIFPSEGKLIGFTRPDVIAKKYYHKHTAHIFVLIVRRELSFSRLPRSKVRQEYLSTPNERQYKRCLAFAVWNQLVLFFGCVTCAGTNYTS